MKGGNTSSSENGVRYTYRIDFPRAPSVLFPPVADYLANHAGHALLARRTIDGTWFRASNPAIAHRAFHYVKQARNLEVRHLPPS